MASMRVAVVQLTAGADKADNLGRLTALVEQAAAHGATLVVAPEASMHEFGAATTALAPVAETLDGPFVSGLVAVASRLGVTVLAGMFEVVPDEPSRAFNTVVAVGPDGHLLGRYRKQHLFDALGWVESHRLEPGDPHDRLLFACGDVTVGVLTCYDLRFPELSRALVDDGAQLLAVPSAWVAGPLKEDQWSTLVRARAIENVVYVAAADQSPPTYVGRAVVVDPFGVVLAAGADRDGVTVADVDVDRLEECRRRMPSLQHRRWSVSPRVASRREG
ncbi:MAG TPA: carbon-nitrogen hydrolase family protein [Mycobacteriales bacterium]|nr:carbon-nitrogen hydrolase family protein [Mycobacteriales bacterium]